MLVRAARGAGRPTFHVLRLYLEGGANAEVKPSVDFRHIRTGVVTEATSEIRDLELGFLEGAGVQGLTLETALEQLSKAP